MSPLLGPSNGANRVVIFRLRGKRSLHQRTGRRVRCGLGNTSQSIQPESVRASRVFVDAYDVNPISLHGSDDGVSRGVQLGDCHRILNQMRGACFTSWRRTTHAEDFCLAVRQSAPSGTSHRSDSKRPGLRLLVTGSIHYTVKTASAASRRRRKSKTVHATRPDQIPPRPFHAPPVIPAQAGTQRKTKHTD